MLENKPYNSSRISSKEERKTRYNNGLTRDNCSPEYFLNDAPNLHKISLI
jgi:hypothetical protein